MSTVLGYLPFLLTALAMTTLTAVYAAPQGARRRTARDALLLNLASHPAAVAAALFYGPGVAFYGVELLLIGLHTAWYRRVTGLTPNQALRVAVLAGVVGQVLGNLLLLALYLATK